MNRGRIGRPGATHLKLGRGPTVLAGAYTHREGAELERAVEEDVDAALRIAQRGYVLETGRIAGSGSSEELLEDPRVREAYLGVA